MRHTKSLQSIYFCFMQVTRLVNRRYVVEFSVFSLLELVLPREDIFQTIVTSCCTTIRRVNVASTRIVVTVHTPKTSAKSTSRSK